MLTTVEGFFDGESVKLSEPVADKKNQRVIVTFVDDSAQVSKPKKKLTAEDRQRIREALANGECVSKDTTDFDVDAYIRESRGYTNFGLDAVMNSKPKKKLTAEDRQRIREALANGECVSKNPIDFDVEAFIRESRGYSNLNANEETKATEEPEELVTRAGA